MVASMANQRMLRSLRCRQPYQWLPEATRRHEAAETERDPTTTYASAVRDLVLRGLRRKDLAELRAYKGAPSAEGESPSIPAISIPQDHVEVFEMIPRALETMREAQRRHLVDLFKRLTEAGLKRKDVSNLECVLWDPTFDDEIRPSVVLTFTRSGVADKLLAEANSLVSDTALTDADLMRALLARELAAYAPKGKVPSIPPKTGPLLWRSGKGG